MPVRPIKVWNSATSEWEDVGVAQPDTSAFVQNSLFTDAEKARFVTTFLLMGA